MPRRDQMLVAETRKLAKLVSLLLAHYGFIETKDGISATAREWSRYSEPRMATVEVTPIIVKEDAYGHPWLACCFNRPANDPLKHWDDPVNIRPYADLDKAIGGVNPHTGKCNIHIFNRMTAEQAASEFERHIRLLLGEAALPWFT